MTNTNPTQKTAIIWSRLGNQDGVKAANLLSNRGVKVELRELGSSNWKKSDVEAAAPGYTSLPQIVVNDVLIGDLAALKANPDFLPLVKKPMLDKAARKAKGVEDRNNRMAAKSMASTARAVASNNVVTGRQDNQTDEQKAAALVRAQAAKIARAEHAAARAVAFKAARPART